MNAPLRHLSDIVDTNSLPPAVLRALEAIATDLRHLPRDCVFDRAELIHWLNRMARRVDGVTAMKILPAPVQSRPKRLALPAANLVEAVFGGPAKSRRPHARTITSRKGKQVRVEIRAQFDLPFTQPQPLAAEHRACGSANQDRQP